MNDEPEILYQDEKVAVLRWGSASFPIREHLGEKTLWVVEKPARGEAFVVEQAPFVLGGLGRYTILTQGPDLNREQLELLQELILEPRSYYNGHPTFRRLPSSPNFAIRLHREGAVLDVMIDLHNPGWEFHCQQEAYRNWNWVGGALTELAKSLFPKLASSHAGSVWKQGGIKALRGRPKKRTASRLDALKNLDSEDLMKFVGKEIAQRRFSQGQLEARQTPACPHCGKRLRTNLAKQCLECGADWH